MFVFVNYTKTFKIITRVLQVGNQSSWLKSKVCSVRGLIANPVSTCILMVWYVLKCCEQHVGLSCDTRYLY
ncbi:hypothetical protein HanRHA438_Chr15g0685931 [Helianthus annuus]|nr:hypothetical protein HanHA89_Chr15g0597521 [Helianthus annuus]KAJ0647192.1 hypothetical protein HanLR1_Chr15g0559161 [Helianthus annuus]KAJ0842943.1 hypothetical protein HanRHA438_Chr15g0685931 [Helianthus annuus]